MGDDDHGAVFFFKAVFQPVNDLSRILREGLGNLIENQKIRIGIKRSGQLHHLSLLHRQMCAGNMERNFHQIPFFEYLQRGLFHRLHMDDSGFLEAFRFAQVDIHRACQRGDDAKFLHYHGHLRLIRREGTVRPVALSPQKHRSLIKGLHAADDTRQGRFARPVLAGQRTDLSAPHRHTDIVVRMRNAKAFM